MNEVGVSRYFHTKGDDGEDDPKIEESRNETTSEESENEDSHAESDDIHPEVKFLPSTVDGLCKRLVNYGGNLCEKENTNIGMR